MGGVDRDVGGKSNKVPGRSLKREYLTLKMSFKLKMFVKSRIRTIFA